MTHMKRVVPTVKVIVLSHSSPFSSPLLLKKKSHIIDA